VESNNLYFLLRATVFVPYYVICRDDDDDDDELIFFFSIFAMPHAASTSSRVRSQLDPTPSFGCVLRR